LIETRIIRADDEEGLSKAAQALKNGKLVAFPTETVYGLGANAYDPEAVKRIFEAKGRPGDNPLIVHISDKGQLKDIVLEVPENARKLMDKFWPGPLTLVLKKSDAVPDVVTAGLDTVAVRMPDNIVALRLIELSGVPVAAPSANLSGRPSPTSAMHVAKDLTGRIEYIIDGGSCSVGVESTVLDVTGDIPVILRPGGVTYEMIGEVCGKVDVYKVGAKAAEKPRSPGMKYRHYSPEADVILVEGENARVVDEINKQVSLAHEKNLKVGVLASEENAGLYKADVVLPAGSAKRPEEIASRLFDCLRKFDDLKVDIIYSETFGEKGIGRAVMNRLKKASAGKIIKV